MNKDRLLKLADFLETVPEERFDMSTWVGNQDHPWNGKADLSCGTNACAMGWATTIPEFAEAGLHLYRDPSGYGHLVFGEKDYFEAAAAFMELSPQGAIHLFGDNRQGRPETPKEIAIKIRRFVRTNGEY